MVDEKGIETFDRRLDLRHMDRSSRWATVAARLAIREAGFSERPSALAKLGLFLNLSAGPSWAESEYLTSFLSNNRQVSQLTAFPYIVPGSVAGNVCRALGLAGHNLTLSAGPGAGLLGLGPAIAALRCGHAEAILSGAVDELTDRILTDQFMTGRFAADRAGLPGEGSAILMLETEHHALARDATPLASICGVAGSTAGEGLAGLEQTVREALAQAGIEPEQATTICAGLPEVRFQDLAGKLCPAWVERRVGVAPGTGWLDGAQILVDLSAALLASPGHSDLREYVLALAGSPHGMNCAVVCKRIEKPVRMR
jgi:3-oxoacyl-(acyl-carrier-protein) synthase